MLQAYECVGKCSFPLPDRSTPTKHAIIQVCVLYVIIMRSLDNIDCYNSVVDDSDYTITIIMIVMMMMLLIVMMMLVIIL